MPLALHLAIMTTDAELEKALQFFRSIAELVAMNLSIVHYHDQVLVKVPDEAWATIIGHSPSWFGFYFLTPGEAFKRMMESPSANEVFQTETSISDPFQKFEQIADRARGMARETVTLAKDFMAHDGPVLFEQGAELSEEFVKELALFKALNAETRSRAVYGQGMLSLVSAGQRGNDEGYLRAVAIDPTVQWHPDLAIRISREAMTGRGSFADDLRKAAQEGPSGKIDKDLNQLRYMLGLLHDLKILQNMQDAERYVVFCHQLGLYPDTGKNPKAALCAFIKRWEANLV